MRYGTLFSGVEGFGLGFDRAGMECAFQCEKDPACRSVLRHRYPAVPKWTDVTEVDPGELPSVDVLAFGSPCQDVSVAGRRAGLAGERSGLFVHAIRIADALAPRWLVFENVPGLLSSQQGEDFAVVLEGFTGFRPAVPDGGWRSCGVCVGPLRWAVWRMLDSQWFGVPQRRLRLFLVAGSRGPREPEILLEPEGLSGHPAPSREAREGSARGATCGTLDARTDGGGFPGTDGACDGHVVANALPIKYRGDPHEGTDTIVTHTLRAEGHDASEDGTGRVVPLALAFAPLQGAVVAFGWNKSPSQTMQVSETPDALQASPTSNPAVLAFDWQQGSDVTNPRPSTMNVTPMSPTLSGSRKPAVTTAIPRRLTPRECERLQGFPDDWTLYGVTDEGKRVKLSDSARYRQMGNAVTVNVAEWIGKRLLPVQSREGTERG